MLLIAIGSIPGPPLTKESSLSLFLKHNVTVGLGIVESWDARNARFDAAWVRAQVGMV